MLEPLEDVDFPLLELLDVFALELPLELDFVAVEREPLEVVAVAFLLGASVLVLTVLLLVCDELLVA